jgi:hypothetical protein
LANPVLNALCERLNQAPCKTLRYQCSPYHVDDALHPVVQRYVRAAHVTPSDDTLFGTDEDQQIKPQMVETTTVSDNRMKYTFTLRDLGCP